MTSLVYKAVSEVHAHLCLSRASDPQERDSQALVSGFTDETDKDSDFPKVTQREAVGSN